MDKQTNWAALFALSYRQMDSTNCTTSCAYAEDKQTDKAKCFTF